jgi:threonine dehydratase
MGRCFILGGIDMIDVKKQVMDAERRIRDHVRETPLEHSPYLSRLGKCQVYLKLETIQFSGSFKSRGAVNKILSLTPEEKDRGIITCSTGNHGMAVAYLLQKFGIKGIIFLPESAAEAKVEAIRLYEANIQQYGDDSLETEIEAKRFADQKGMIWISPYNDPYIVGGQGTIAVELERQLDCPNTILVPIGGGGLISGIAGYLKSKDDGIEFIGCQPENSRVMYESIKAGKILDMESQPTLSDATAGGVEQGSITFDIIRELVDDFVVVNEVEIKNAIRLILEKHYMLIEGSAALSVASFLKEKERFQGKHVVLIITGSKISVDKLKAVLA